MNSEQSIQDASTTVAESISSAQQMSGAHDGANTDSDDSYIQIGDMLLDVYRVESGPIHGGMGSVWRVHHTGWNVDLAMKRPQPKHFTSSASKADFIRECQSWVSLGLHPNIVSCYYIREIGGTPTIFSEWMDGGSLKDAIRHKTLYHGSMSEQQSRLLDIAIQISRGLAYAHKRDLIHQDIKPDNLLLTGQWNAKVGDFGLSRAKNAFQFVEDALDEFDEAVGDVSVCLPSGGCTLAYCSSEQLSGKSLKRQTDIYSWAVTMLEMYLGTRPWPSGVVAGIGCQDYFEHTCVPLSARMRDLLAYCLMANPDLRPYDFNEVETELLAIYQEEVGVPYPRPAYQPASETADSLNNKALSYLDLGLQEQAQLCWEKALKLNPNHLLTIYNAALYLWRAAEMDDATAISRVKLIGANSASEDTARLIDMLNIERGMPKTQKLEQEIALPPVSYPELNKAVISEDGSFALLPLSDGIRRVDCSCATVSLLSGPHLEGQIRIALSSNGAIGLSSDGKHTAALWDAASGALIRTLNADYDFLIDNLAFDPNGVLAAAVMTNKETSVHSVALWNVETGELLRTFDVYGMASFLCFTPDGNYIACDSTCSGYSNDIKTEIHLWNVKSGKYERSFNVLEPGKAIISVSKDGMSIAAGGGHYSSSANNKLMAWSLITRKPICYLHSHSGSITALKLNREGTLVISGSADGSVKLWEIPSGRCLSTLGESYQSVNAVSFTPDEQSILAVVTSHKESPSQFHLVSWRVPSFTSQANMEIAKIVSFSDFQDRERRFNALLAQARRALTRNKPGNALDYLMEARRISGFENNHDWQTVYSVVAAYCRVDGLHSTAIDSPIDFDKQIASFTACSNHLLYITCENRDVFRMNLDNGELPPVRFEQQKRFLTVAQSGARYCLSDIAETVTCFNAETKEPIASIQASLKSEFLPKRDYIGGTVIGDIGLCRTAMSRDGRFSALGDFNGMIQLWQIDSGVLARCCGRHEGRIEHLEFSPDGARLLSCGLDRQYRVWDVASGKCLFETQDIHCWTQTGCFTPDGKQIIIVGEAYDILCVNYATGEQISRFPGRNEKILRLCVSPDGSTIFVLTRGYLDLFDRNGTREQRSIPLQKEANDCCLSPDGTILYLNYVKTCEISCLRLEWDYVYVKPDSILMRGRQKFRDLFRRA